MTVKLCYHCFKEAINPVVDYEFHKDGVYCSRQCLVDEMEMLADCEAVENDLLRKEQEEIENALRADY